MTDSFNERHAARSRAVCAAMAEAGGALTGSKDNYPDHCGECVHFAPWPERVERMRELWDTVPMGYPTGACMACPTSAFATAPGDSPSNPSSIAAGCPHFQRGSRAAYLKEACR